MVKISVIIPVYNAEKFLRRCLDSVIKQTIIEKEVICIDDGSTDDSLGILKEYEKQYAYVHVLTQKNQYAGVARNNGLLKAKGEYIHFLDADDYILSDIYFDVYTTAKEMNADYIKTRNIAFDLKTEKYIQNEIYSLENWDISYFNRIISVKECPEILLKTSVAPWSGWIRRKYILEKQIYFNDLKCVNDRSFYVQAICNTERVAVLDKYVVGHQVNNEKSLVGIRSLNYICHLKSFELIKNKVKRLPDDLKRKVLSAELYDLVYYYEKLTLDQKVKNQLLLRGFFENFNWEEVDMELLFDPIMNQIYKDMKIHLWDIFGSNMKIQCDDDLKECTNIIIYGAGRVCKVLTGYLLENQKESVIGIVVSNTDGNPDNINGIPVKEKSKAVLDQAQVIIIAALEKFHIYIYQTLLQLGYKNVKVITEDMYLKMKKRLCPNEEMNM